MFPRGKTILLSLRIKISRGVVKVFCVVFQLAFSSNHKFLRYYILDDNFASCIFIYRFLNRYAPLDLGQYPFGLHPHNLTGTSVTHFLRIEHFCLYVRIYTTRKSRFMLFLSFCCNIPEGQLASAESLPVLSCCHDYMESDMRLLFYTQREPNGCSFFSDDEHRLDIVLEFWYSVF